MKNKLHKLLFIGSLLSGGCQDTSRTYENEVREMTDSFAGQIYFNDRQIQIAKDSGSSDSFNPSDLNLYTDISESSDFEINNPNLASDLGVSSLEFDFGTNLDWQVESDLNIDVDAEIEIDAEPQEENLDVPELLPPELRPFHRPIPGCEPEFSFTEIERSYISSLEEFGLFTLDPLYEIPAPGGRPAFTIHNPEDCSPINLEKIEIYCDNSNQDNLPINLINISNGASIRESRCGVLQSDVQGNFDNLDECEIGTNRTNEYIIDLDPTIYGLDNVDPRSCNLKVKNALFRNNFTRQLFSDLLIHSINTVQNVPAKLNALMSAYESRVFGGFNRVFDIDLSNYDSQNTDENGVPIRTRLERIYLDVRSFEVDIESFSINFDNQVIEHFPFENLGNGLVVLEPTQNVLISNGFMNRRGQISVEINDRNDLSEIVVDIVDIETSWNGFEYPSNHLIPFLRTQRAILRNW